MANEQYFPNSGSENDMWTSLEGTYEHTGEFFIGRNRNDPGSTDRKYASAYRFPNISGISDGGCDYAGFYLWTQYYGNDEGNPQSGSWNFTVAGIDEDNTADFSSGNPFSRSKTSAVETSNNGNNPNLNTWKEINVTGPVNEIMARGGWNTNNAIGLLFEATADANVNKYAGEISDKKSFLLIRRDSEPNFTPAPISVAAPTFPTIDSYGIKISYPGYDVKTATEDQTYFTSKKRHLKLIFEGKVNTTGGVTATIAHGQSVIPCVRAYMKSPTTALRYKMPRYLPGEMQSPDSDQVNGTIEVDATNLRITTTDSTEVYYQVYIDQLST